MHVCFIILVKVMSKYRIDLESKTKWAEKKDEVAEMEMKLNSTSCEEYCSSQD